MSHAEWSQTFLCFSVSFWIYFEERERGRSWVLLFIGVKVRLDKNLESLTSYSPGVTEHKSIIGIWARTLSPCFRPVLLRNALEQPQYSWSPPWGDKKEKWVAVNQKRLGHLFYPKNSLEIRNFCKLTSTLVIQIYKMLAIFGSIISLNHYFSLSRILRIVSYFKPISLGFLTWYFFNYNNKDILKFLHYDWWCLYYNCLTLLNTHI